MGTWNFLCRTACVGGLYLVLGTQALGCAQKEVRQYNQDDVQNLACYASYGGEKGYCDLPLL